MTEMQVGLEETQDPAKAVEGEVTTDGETTRIVIDTEAAKAAEAEAEAEAKAESELILGKFKSQEELEKAYQELEQKQSKETEVPATPEAARISVSEAGFKMEELSKEFAENSGALTEETLTKLEKAGIERATVDQYIAGQQAIATQVAASLTEVAGGAEALRSVLDWAGTNLTEAEADAYNSALDSGNIEAAKLALQGVAAKYTAAVGSEPSLVEGEAAAGVTGVAPFGSQQEVIAAMKDPRYKSGDPAYVKSVEKRLAVTQMFGVR